MRFNGLRRNGKGSSCQSFALAKTGPPGGRVLLPQALVDPGDPNENPSGYGSSRQDQAEVGDVAVIDEASGEPLHGVAPDDAREPLPPDAERPRQAARPPGVPAPALRGLRRQAHTRCSSAASASTTSSSYDALAASPARAMRRRWDVAAGPTGIAVDPDEGPRRRLVAVRADAQRAAARRARPRRRQGRRTSRRRSAHSRSAQPTHPIPVSTSRSAACSSTWSGDERISHDGRACASCHPDGRDDSLVLVDAERAAPQHHARRARGRHGAVLVERHRARRSRSTWASRSRA